MINEQLLNPKSIVIIGGSNDIHKPGGKVLFNLLQSNFAGKVFVVNPKEEKVCGIAAHQDVRDLPEVDLAVLAIPAKFCVEAVEILTSTKKTRAFIILSAGFSETSHEGALLEKQIVEIVDKVGGALIGPNGIGMLTPNYAAIFTSPVPELSPDGVDFISGSGATAVFILELGIPNGLRFANLYSVGNSAQIGIEEVLQHMDETFDAKKSPKVKLLYLEKIDKPQLFLKHASSLIRKGCRIAAVKSGSSSAGSRAASSHTGALAGSDVAVDVLFRKAGVVRCYGRQELITVASVFKHPELKGKNIGIITHAGGPAVMLTDALEKGGLSVPKINNKYSEELLTKLFPGSSVANPIDFLATGTAAQLETIIDYCDTKFDEIDAMVIIFGTPGLSEVFDAYEVIDRKMKTCRKPIFPVLPSLNEAKREVAEFLSKGRINFPEEVLLGNALSKIYFTPKPLSENIDLPKIDEKSIRKEIEKSADGYLSPESVQNLLDAAAIPRAKEFVAETAEKAKKFAGEIGYPLVMKVVGPVHKSDVGGVVLNVKTESQMTEEFARMMKIKDTTAVLLQPFLKGFELFVGAKREEKFGHTILCGLGGIYIEVFKDTASGLLPVGKNEAVTMIKSLKSYKLFEGARGQEGININSFAEIISRLSALLQIAPEIAEMDINPLLGTKEKLTAVDCRIRIEK
jgi:acetyltransferase